VGSSRASRRERAIDGVLWVLCYVSIALTLLWALGPPPPGGRLFPGADKVVHALAFGSILGTFLLAGVWRPGRGFGSRPRAVGPAIAALVAAGVVIEIVQGELVRRDADLLDVAAEVVGLGMALLIVRLMGWRPRDLPSRAP
jgi:hypothetical protein